MAEPAARRVPRGITLVGRDVTDSRALRVALLDEIRRNVAFDAYAWLLTDPETEVGSDPLADVPCLSELPRLIRLKYSTEVNRWTGLATPVGRLHSATGGRLEESLVWRELLSDFAVTDVASVVFRDPFGCWGFLDLWRTGAAPFSDRDADYLASIAPDVTERLRRSQAHTFSATPLPPVPKGPNVLVLSPDLGVMAQTPQTETYLRALLPPHGDRQPIPAGAYNVGAQLIADEAGVDDHPPRARVHLGAGVWLSLRAARMGGANSESADIAVTIELASQDERMDLFSRAYGLSPRETELVAALARGADTRQLADALYISENTVQDHFKSVFAKTSTRTRRVLLARMLGS